MTIKFLIPGKVKEDFLTSGYKEYIKRLNGFAKTKIIFIQEESLKEKPTEKDVQKALDLEANSFLKQIKEDDQVFLLDTHSKTISSDDLALKIKETSQKNGNLVFIIGSSFGLSDKMRERANFSFSLSKMTFTHYLALLFLLEQVYRSFKINSNQIYAK